MKRHGKRIVSAVLVVILLMTLLPVFANEGSGKAALGLSGLPRIKVTDSRVRGVLNDIDELDVIAKFMGYAGGYNKNAVLGTPEHPFLVLEIVPYLEYAEIGYLIGDCEPVDIDLIRDGDVTGSGSLTFIDKLNSLGTFYGIDGNGIAGASTTAYFFEGEPGYEWYAQRAEDGGSDIFTAVTSGNSVVHGYYEKAADGKGHYKIEGIDGLEAAYAAYLETLLTLQGAGNEGDTEADDVSAEGVDMTAGEPEGGVESAGDVDVSAGEPGEGTEPAGQDTEAEEKDEGLESAGDANADGGDTDAADAEVSSKVSAVEAWSAKEVRIVLTSQEDRGNVGGIGAGNGDDGSADGTGDSAGDGLAEDGYTDGSGLAGSDSAGENGLTEEGSTEGSGLAGSDSAEGSGLAESDTTEENGFTEDVLSSGSDADTGMLLMDSPEGVVSIAADLITITYSEEGGDGFEWEWHSLTQEQCVGEYTGTNFYDLKNVQEEDIEGLSEEYAQVCRIYASRGVNDVSGATPGYIEMSNYRFYENSELFLKESILKGSLDDAELEAQLEGYSIVVKTITPDRLNENPEWIDCADLIYLSSADHDEELVEIWEKYGWLKGEDTQDGSQGTVSREQNAYESNDLDWTTALKLYYKVLGLTENEGTGKMEETDHAGLIIDDSIYDLTASKGFYTQKSVRDINIKVFDWNLKATDGDVGNIAVKGSSNNIYKLAVMLQAMDSYLFRSLYLSPDDPSGAVIQSVTADGGNSKGINTLQSAYTGPDAGEYWSVQTFLLRNPYMDMDKYKALGDDYWWENYHTIRNPLDSKYKYSASEHVFICPGENGIVQGYGEAMNLSVNASDYRARFSDFDEYLDAYLKEEGLQKSNEAPKPADAVRYILRNTEEEQPGSYKEIKVLDLEPSVKVNETPEKVSPDWFLKESYVRMLVPFYRGEIEIIHRTMAEFIGMFEDPVSEYQLIYLGADTSGAGGIQDGLIYTGSKDISERRMNELEEFIKAKHPIIAEYPIAAESDRYSQTEEQAKGVPNIYSFLQTAKAQTGNSQMLFGIEEVGKAGKAVLQLRKIADITGPVEYEAADETQKKYLESEGSNAYMNFTVTFTDSGEYGYRIYVDRDGDLDFERSSGGYSELIKEDSIVISKDAIEARGTAQATIRCPLPKKVGLVHWKIEVYVKNSEAKREVLTGFSAVGSESGKKEEIRVLQILDDDLKGVLELSKWVAEWKTDLGDYNITSNPDDVMTREMFESIFRSEEDKPAFRYDEDTGFNGLEYLKTDLMKYDVIIVGLKAGQDGKLFTVDGAADFLRYWAAMGKGIIYLNGLTPADVSAVSEDDGIIQTAANGITTKVSQLNQGLSGYPLKVSVENIRASVTPSQITPLKPDDKGVTVWYCLAGGEHAWNDAMNRYGIYSNHNVFCSSIEYSKDSVTKDEQKLFINTVVAAYNASDSGPVVEIGNPETEKRLNQMYEICELMRSYDYNKEDGWYDPAGDIVGSENDYLISFKFVESDPYVENAAYKCIVQYYDENDNSGSDAPAPRIYSKDSGTDVTYTKNENGVYVFSGLKENETYILKYPNKYMDPDTASERDHSYPKIKFKVENASRNYEETFTTVLKMSEQPLFPLD